MIDRWRLPVNGQAHENPMSEYPTMVNSTEYYRDRSSWLNQAGSFGSILVLMLMPFFLPEMTPFLVTINILAALLVMLTIVHHRFVWEFSISDGNVQTMHGITSKKQQSIPLKNIRDISVKQTTIQRVFGVGDVEFSAVGSINNRIVFYGITAPFEFMEQVLQVQRRRKRKKRRK